MHEKQASANNKRAAETMTETLSRGQVFPRELIPFPPGPLGITLEANLPIPSRQCVSRPGWDSAGVRADQVEFSTIWARPDVLHDVCRVPEGLVADFIEPSPSRDRERCELPLKSDNKTKYSRY